MKTIPTTRRGALGAFLALFSGLVTPTKARAAKPPHRATWRQLTPDDVFQETDVGAKTNPALIALMLQSGSLVRGDWRTLCPAPEFMLGRPVSHLTSPSPREMSWWRPEPGTPAPASKTHFKKLEEETLRAGDLYASHDPNESLSSLLPQEGHTWKGIATVYLMPLAEDYELLGRRAADIPPGNGGYWRLTQAAS